VTARLTRTIASGKWRAFRSASIGRVTPSAAVLHASGASPTGRRNLAAHPRDDVVADGEAEAGRQTDRLGGEEGIEDLLEDPGRNPQILRSWYGAWGTQPGGNGRMSGGLAGRMGEKGAAPQGPAKTPGRPRRPSARS